MKNERSYSRYSFRGDVARVYDRFNTLASIGADRGWRRRTAKIMAADLEPLTSHPFILDLACGTMDMGLAVARALPESIVIGTDAEREMTRFGKAKLPDGNGRIHILTAAGRLPFRDRTFAAISCAFGLRNFVDLPGALAEMTRSLVPGGRIYVLEFFRPPNRISRLFLHLLRKIVFPVLGLILTGNRHPYNYLADSIFSFLSIEELEGVLKEMGLIPSIRCRFCLGLVQLTVACKPR